MALVGFFLPAYAMAEIRTHVSRVAPTHDLMKDALSTKQPRRGRTPELSYTLVKSSRVTDFLVRSRIVDFAHCRF